MLAKLSASFIIKSRSVQRASTTEAWPLAPFSSQLTGLRGSEVVAAAVGESEDPPLLFLPFTAAPLPLPPFRSAALKLQLEGEAVSWRSQPEMNRRSGFRLSMYLEG